MASFEIVNSGSTIQIMRYTHDNATHKTFQEACNQAHAELNHSIQAFDKMAVNQKPLVKMMQIRENLKICTEKDCMILVDSDVTTTYPPAPTPDVQK